LFELIGPAYQPWYSIFLSQENSINQLISRKNYQPEIYKGPHIIGNTPLMFMVLSDFTKLIRR
jgi:hypothetical protein